MKKVILSIPLVCSIFATSCGDGGNEPLNDSVPGPDTTQDWSFTRMYDTIQILLDRASVVDTLEHRSSSFVPMLFFKSGYILNSSVKHAVVVYSVSDSALRVDLYEINAHGCGKKQNSIELPGPGVAFDVLLDDYDFDGSKDVFVVQTATNGTGTLWGHLLLFEPSVSFDQLVLFSNADTTFNFVPDKERKVLVTDSLIWCKEGKSYCKTEYEWQERNLVRKNVKCPCSEK